MASDKDTIYIDIDDEITGIIDKVKNSSSKVTALVLPKRASVFQSIVNMKLLKKAADSSNKNLVLITTEAGLLPLAGAAGIHVAKTLTTKPEIPSAPLAFEDNDDAVDEDSAVLPMDTEPVDPNKTVGQLAGSKAPAGAVAADGVETLELDNSSPEEPLSDEGSKAKKGAAAVAASKKDKKLKVPNFERFRKYLVIGVILLILLILLLIFANSSLAKATINITTDATNIPTNVSLNLSTTASSVDPSTGNIPAKFDTQQKTFTQQVGTTGQKNNGNKASGTIGMTATACAPNIGQPSDVPSGTGVSSNGLTYITQQDTSFTNISGGHGNCVTYRGDNATPIIAQSGGANFNNTTTFTVAGRSDVTATDSSPITGGTDNIVQTVNQNDINSAKSKISTNDNSVKSTLQSQLQGEGYYPITATYNVGTPNVSTSANVGDAASNVTVTETISYTMFGVHQSDLKTLVDSSVKTQIDTSKQSILSEGLSSAIFNVNNLSSTGGSLSMSTKAVAGPQLDIATIKKNAAGKKSGEIKSQLLTDPDVTNVNVKFSPFWVTTVPSSPSKITVNIAKPTTTK